MEFAFTPDQDLLRQSVREFAETEVAPVALEHDEKQEFPYEIVKKAAELGAHHGVNHYDETWPKEVRKLTGGRGVDVVVEHVGQAVFANAVTTLAHGGRLVTCGATTGADARVSLAHLFVKQISLLGSYMADFHELVEVVALLEAGHLRPVVDRVFPVREAAAAHRRLESGEHFGKIVLQHG